MGYKLICKECGKNFIGTGTKQLYCKDCETVTITCCICNNEFKISRWKYNYKLKNNPNSIMTCSRKCSSTYASRVNIEKKYIAYCEKCKTDTKHFSTGLCCRCHALKNCLEPFLEFSKSEKCLEIRRKNADKYVHSEIGRANASKMLKKYMQSEAGKEHLKKNLENIHQKMRNGKLANTPERLSQRIEYMRNIQREYERIIRDNDINNPNYEKALKLHNSRMEGFKKYLDPFCKLAWEHYKDGTASESEIKFCEGSYGGGGYFDRDAFYASDLDICSFEVNGSTEDDMTLSEFVKKYDKVGSVKAYELVSSDGKLIKTLDVAKSNGTTNEISWFHRTMKVAKEQRDIPEEKLVKLSDSRIRLKRRKYLEDMELHPNSKIRIKIVFCFDHSVDAGSEDECKLYSIEAQYAHDSKAEYWSPQVKVTVKN